LFTSKMAKTFLPNTSAASRELQLFTNIGKPLIFLVYGGSRRFS